MSNELKAIWSGAIAAVTVYFGNLMIPITVLTIVMLTDYASGFIKACILGKLNSKAGWLGVAKKVGGLCLVGVATVVDYLLAEAGELVSIDLPFSMAFGIFVTVWLILSDCISIIENLAEVGVPIPQIFRKILKNAKEKIDEKGEHES